MLAVESEIRCSRYGGWLLLSELVSLEIRSVRYDTNCFARWDFPDVGKPVMMMSWTWI
jgi:hypothetical protein